MTAEELIDKIANVFKDGEISPSSINVFVDSDETSVSVVNRSNDGLEIVYVTEEDEDGFTLSDLYDKLNRCKAQPKDKVFAVCDDQDRDENEPKDVKSADCNAKKKYVILKTK